MKGPKDPQGTLQLSQSDTAVMHGFAVRGINQYGQDVLCQSVAAGNAANALLHMLVWHPAEAQDARAWVVTKLGK